LCDCCAELQPTGHNTLRGVAPNVHVLRLTPPALSKRNLCKSGRMGSFTVENHSVRFTESWCAESEIISTRNKRWKQTWRRKEGDKEVTKVSTYLIGSSHRDTKKSGGRLSVNKHKMHR
jgi:hypothetical protein